MQPSSSPLIYQALTPISASPTAFTTSLISPNTLTFMATTIPLVIFILISVLTISQALHRKDHRLKESFFGLKLALIVGSIPIGVSLLLSQTNLVIKAEKDPTPRHIRLESTSSNSAVIKWRTGSKSTGGYRLSLTPDFTNPTATYTDSQTYSLTHHFIIDRLQSQTTYYLHLFSENTWYDNNGQPLVFTTNP